MSRRKMTQLLCLMVGISQALLVSGSDIQYMRDALETYFGDIRHHDIDPEYKKASKEFIYNEFKRFGLDTEYSNFKAPEFSQTATFVNVIGILKGKNFGTAEDKIVGIGAHYDTVNTTAGVDDDGSGIVVMLDIAMHLTDMNNKGMKRNNTIFFVAFDMEETGIKASVGSKDFVENWLVTWISRNYGNAASNLQPHGVIVLDCIMEWNTSANSQLIPGNNVQAFQQSFPKVYANLQADGFRGDFLGLGFRSPTKDAALAAAIDASWSQTTQAKFEIELFPLPYADPAQIELVPHMADFLRSDHQNFWKHDFPGVLIFDFANMRGDMIQCYHQPCDNLKVMVTDDNMESLGKTSRAIYKTMDMLSESYGLDTSSAIQTKPTWLFVFQVIAMMCFITR